MARRADRYGVGPSRTHAQDAAPGTTTTGPCRE